MVVAFKLIRRPRTRQTPAIIKRELEKAYRQILLPHIKDVLQKELFDWKLKPQFRFKIQISGKRYLVQVIVNTETHAGKVFMWVDRGTADEGSPGTTYPIDPVNAPALVFDVPYQPKTLPPVPPGLGYDLNEPSKTISIGHVDHPGIRPRRISEKMRKKVNNRRNRKGFYRVTENAYRRGFRKIKSYRV